LSPNLECGIFFQSKSTAFNKTAFLPTANGLGFMAIIENKLKIPEDLERCVEFHGHICPGLIYGYLVAKEAMKLMELQRAIDESVGCRLYS